VWCSERAGGEPHRLRRAAEALRDDRTTRGATENEPRSRSGNDVAFGGNALGGIEQLPRSVERRRIVLEIDHEHGGDVREARQRERSNALVMRFARSGYPEHTSRQRRTEP
jgi:hypothetical protein